MGVTSVLHGQRRRARELDRIEERLVWISCSPRSGSTWLLNLIGLEPEVVMMNEPLIGIHLGLFTTDLVETPPQDSIPTDRQVFHRIRAKSDEYFFAESFRHAWAPHLRALLLERAAAHVERYGQPVPDGVTPLVCVKEPMGAQASDLIMRVLPKSRILHLVRDPRDVVSSLLDAYRAGTWFGEMYPEWDFTGVPREQRVRDFATRWRVRAEVSMDAYRKHDPERRLLVRYEELRANSEEGLMRIFDWMGLPTVSAADYVERMRFEKVSREKTGEGQFHRRAKPGGWREELRIDEIRLIEEECAGPMRDLGYEAVAVPLA
jgi:hypothetical protein